MSILQEICSENYIYIIYIFTHIFYWSKDAEYGVEWRSKVNDADTKQIM